MALLVTTTGVISNILLNDLGGRSLTHPTSSLDLELEYNLEELIESGDLQSAITNGYITVTDESLNSITELSDLLLKKSTYDSDDNSIIDTSQNSNNLGGFPGSYYLDASNFTGTFSGIIDESQLSFYSLLFRGNQLISGGISWLENLDFWVSDLTYLIGDQFYETQGMTKSLSPADSSFDRIDVFIGDSNGDVIILEGTPSLNPIKPDVDEESQVEVSFVTVPASSTEPSIDRFIIFDEDLGDPLEWSPTYSSDFIIDTESYGGTYGIHLVGSTQGNLYFGLSQSDTINFDLIQFFIKSKGSWSGKYVRAALYNNDIRLSNWTRIEDGYQGFDSSNTDDWQVLTIRKSAISLESNFIDEIRFELCGGTVSVGFYIDNINYQYGIGYDKNELVTVGDLETGLIGAFGAYSMFGNTTETPNNGISVPVKVSGVTTIQPLTSGFDDGGFDNRLIFTEADTRTFEVECNLTAESAFSNNTYQFFFYKNGGSPEKPAEKLESSKITVDFVSGGNAQTVVLGDFVDLSQGDYIEVWCQNDSSNNPNFSVTIDSMNMRVKKIN